MDMEQVKEIIDRLKSDYEFAVKNDNTAVYSNLASTFNKSEDILREYIQAELASDIKLIISKLKDRDSLSYDEVQLIRRMLVGDAENYVKWENNYQDWIDELHRLMGEIDAASVQQMDVASAEKLRALTKDAKRVVDDIICFHEQQERVKRFEDATRDIDIEERGVIIGLLQGELQSAQH
jgi:hypothetical protein